MRSWGRHGRGLEWRLGYFGVLALMACLTAAFAGSATATTAPGTDFVVRAVMTDSGVVLVPVKNDGKYIRRDGLAATFPRAAIITFSFLNKGSKPYLPALRILNAANANPYVTADRQKLLTGQRVAPPGGRVDLRINFYFRGPFHLLELSQKKPHGKAVQITIT